MIYGYGSEDLSVYDITNLDLNQETFGITQIAALNNRISNENEIFSRPSDTNAIEFSLNNVNFIISLKNLIHSILFILLAYNTKLI